MKTEKLAKAYRIENGKHFRLKDFDPADCGHWSSKDHAAQALQEGIVRTAELQDMLYAQNQWAVLLIFQAMDAAGKDGIIKHVMGFRQFSLRGLSNVTAEWSLVALAWNIKRMNVLRGV